MPTKFEPVYRVSSAMAECLMRVEGAKEKAALLPLNLAVLASLRATAKLRTTHYSTAIEGNQLQPEEVKRVLQLKSHFPGKERDAREVKGHYAALAQLD